MRCKCGERDMDGPSSFHYALHYGTYLLVDLLNHLILNYDLNAEGSVWHELFSIFWESGKLFEVVIPRHDSAVEVD